MRLVFAAAAAVLFVASASAQSAPQTAPEQPAPVADPAPAATTAPVAPTAQPEQPKPKLICRRVSDTGSHKDRKICATKEEWKASGQ